MPTNLNKEQGSGAGILPVTQKKRFRPHPVCEKSTIPAICGAHRPKIREAHLSADKVSQHSSSGKDRLLFEKCFGRPWDLAWEMENIVFPGKVPIRSVCWDRVISLMTNFPLNGRESRSREGSYPHMPQIWASRISTGCGYFYRVDTEGNRIAQPIGSHKSYYVN